MPDDISRITLYLTTDERAKLERLADHDKRSVSNLVAVWAETRYREVFGSEPPPPRKEQVKGKRGRVQAA